jgi:hypothetical protein
MRGRRPSRLPWRIARKWGDNAYPPRPFARAAPCAARRLIADLIPESLSDSRVRTQPMRTRPHIGLFGALEHCVAQSKANSVVRRHRSEAQDTREEPSRVTKRWRFDRPPIAAKTTLSGIGTPAGRGFVSPAVTLPILPRPLPPPRAPQRREPTVGWSPPVAPPPVVQVAPADRPHIYDAAMTPRIVWEPQPAPAIPVEDELRQRRLRNRRRIVASVAALLIGAGVFTEVVALSDRQVAARSEPVPQQTLAQAMAPAESPPAPPATVPTAAIAEVAVTSLPVAAPTPMRTTTVAPPVQHRAQPLPGTQPRVAPVTTHASPPARVRPQSPPVEAPDDPFVSAARAPVANAGAPAPSPRAAAKPAVDDGF